MFGLGKKQRVKELDNYVSNTLALLGSGGDARAREAISGLQSAQFYSDKLRDKGHSNMEIAKLLMNQSSQLKNQTSGTALSYFLVAIMYECRGINTSASLQLATRISDIIREVLSSQASTQSSQKAASSQTRETIKHTSQPEQKSTNNKIESAVGVAHFLVKALDALHVYKERPGRLLAPHAMGYIYGWCDATTQALGMQKNSDEGLAAMTAMFMAVYVNP